MEKWYNFDELNDSYTVCEVEGNNLPEKSISPPGPAIEQYDLIAHNLREIRAYRDKKCFVRESGLNSMNCWCRRAGPNNADLPCPQIPVI